MHHPLIIASQHLQGHEELAKQVEREAERYVLDAIEVAKAAPEADPAEAFTDVWADGSAAWRT